MKNTEYVNKTQGLSGSLAMCYIYIHGKENLILYSYYFTSNRVQDDTIQFTDFPPSYTNSPSVCISQAFSILLSLYLLCTMNYDFQSTYL